MEDYVSKMKKDALYTVQMLFSYGFKDAISYHKENGFYTHHYYEWVSEHRALLNSYCLHMSAGETKVCIYDDHFDCDSWVIKVGFLRETSPYLVARRSGFDFCAREAQYYTKASKLGLDEFFATTYSCGLVDGVEVFIQERVDIVEDRVSDRIYDYVSSQYPEDQYPDKSSREDCIASAVEYCEDEDIVRAVLGESEKVESLIDFLTEYNINDLHSGNWGTTWDGRMVMVDFSGYILE